MGRRSEWRLASRVRRVVFDVDAVFGWVELVDERSPGTERCWFVFGEGSDL